MEIKKNLPEEINKMLEEHKKEVETNGGKFTNEKYYLECIQYYDYTEKYYNNPLTLKELKEKFTDIKRGYYIWGY